MWQSLNMKTLTEPMSLPGSLRTEFEAHGLWRTCLKFPTSSRQAASTLHSYDSDEAWSWMTEKSCGRWVVPKVQSSSCCPSWLPRDSITSQESRGLWPLQQGHRQGLSGLLPALQPADEPQKTLCSCSPRALAGESTAGQKAFP